MIINPPKLNLGDKIEIIAPSRPIIRIKKEIDSGAKIMTASGYLVEYGQNINQKLYYSAGTPGEKADDLNKAFANTEVKAIFCATGGSSSNQILDLLDYDAIQGNPKIFLGYSDITVLHLAIQAKTGLTTFYGPGLSDLSEIANSAKKFLIDIISGEVTSFPQDFEVIKPGKMTGKLLGGYLESITSLLSSQYSPSYDNAILFWEAAGLCPAQIDLQLNELKLNGVFNKISGMVVGHLSDCVDHKYSEDNRPINEIIHSATKNHDFPIIKVDYFGHDLNNFLTLPIGVTASIDTDKKEFKILESPVK